MRYRIDLETNEDAEGGWHVSAHYEVGPCRGGPVFNDGPFDDEGAAIRHGIKWLRNELERQ